MTSNAQFVCNLEVSGPPFRVRRVDVVHPEKCIAGSFFHSQSQAGPGTCTRLEGRSSVGMNVIGRAMRAEIVSMEYVVVVLLHSGGVDGGFGGS